MGDGNACPNEEKRNITIKDVEEGKYNVREMEKEQEGKEDSTKNNALTDEKQK